jgi:hypothetical protein
LAATGWPPRIAALVAHHSGARYAAEARVLAEQLQAFRCEQSPVSDALIYADQTVGPNGLSMNLEQRLADMLERHGPDSPNAAAHARRARSCVPQSSGSISAWPPRVTPPQWREFPAPPGITAAIRPVARRPGRSRGHRRPQINCVRADSHGVASVASR